MLANRPATSDGGPGVSRTRHLGASRQSPSPVALQVRQGTGDPAAAHRLACPSSRDVDRLSSDDRRGQAAITQPAVRGPIGQPLRFAGRATTLALSHGRFATFQARHRWLCRSIPASTTNGVGDPIRSSTSDPTLIMP